MGNPFWMAPEMMKGNKYDEKVDVFSFGIILCEVYIYSFNFNSMHCFHVISCTQKGFFLHFQLIGRVHADPDFLPRSGDFSLNQKTFLEKFCVGCPEPLYRIAFMCCDLNPDRRYFYLKSKIACIAYVYFTIC